EWFKEHPNRMIYILGPDKADVKLPTETEVLNAIAAIENRKDIAPYEEKLVSNTLITELPKAGSVISKTGNDKLNSTELVLSNGVKVTLKPTQFKNDEILMTASRFGGKNHYGAKDKFNAEYAVQLVNTMGVGEFSPADLRKVLAGKSVSVTPTLSGISEGIRGNSENKDLEVILQLTYLY